MGSEDNQVEYKFLSKFYDVFDLIFLLGGRGNPRQGLLALVGDEPQQILDVCVGTAASALLVAEHFPNSRVVGIDISKDMLAVAQKKIARKSLTNLNVYPMSADAMTFPDNSFDKVMVSFALHELDPKLLRRVFKEIGRVLKPGGKFFVLDFARQQGLRNQVFLGIWALMEPACFRPFLKLNWRDLTLTQGLLFESEAEYSFSKLYELNKKMD
jgi:demethylmenaquinone methyltransferase/2-methoxy-6-polyprenyl-1,4-benzoquinol methylase